MKNSRGVEKKTGNIFEIVFKSVTVLGLVILIVLQFRTSGDKIVYVDSVKLMNGFKGMKDARAAYEAKTSVWKSNLDSLERELKAKITDYQSKANKLSEKEKQLTEELLTTKQKQYMEYQQIISEKIQNEDQQLTSGVVSRINEYLKQYGEEKGYSIIMAATQYGNIVYSDKAYDITDEVLVGLNSAYN